ncbi:MAG: hypothetical protein HP494_13555 [Nitrospira sp.]|nr:hypothetical protein [Nitrospira sp.]
MSIRRVSYLATGVCLLGAIAVSSPGSVSEAAAPAKAYFAGGCFWCMEEAFEQVEGVVSVVIGSRQKPTEYKTFRLWTRLSCPSTALRAATFRISSNRPITRFWSQIFGISAPSMPLTLL